MRFAKPAGPVNLCLGIVLSVFRQIIMYHNDITNDYTTKIIRSIKPDFMSDIYTNQVEMIHDARMLGYNLLLNGIMAVELSKKFTEVIAYDQVTLDDTVIWRKRLQ